MTAWRRSDLASRRSATVAREVWDRLEARRTEMADLLGDLVRIESPSGDRQGLDAVADWLRDLFAGFGNLTSHATGPGGARHLVVEIDDVVEPEAPHTAVLGHYDTVWPVGSLDRLPFSIDADGIITGPGCFDMKGGLVLLHFALRELATLGVAPRRPVRILFNCDEEVRSRTSRDLITQVATGAAMAYVLESPLPGGVLKSGRKGAAIYRLVVDGRAAHAGIEPDKGASAVVEIAHQIARLHQLNERERGTTVNVGVVSGGTRPNIVAAHAEAEIDVRTTTAAEARRVDQAIHDLTPRLSGTTLTPVPDLSRPPMEATDASRALFAKIQTIAFEAGMPELDHGSTGGASDANLVAAMGVPTLDGFGPEGGGAHADDEHVRLDSMPQRAALIAAVLAEV